MDPLLTTPNPKVQVPSVVPFEKPCHLMYVYIFNVSYNDDMLSMLSLHRKICKESIQLYHWQSHFN